MSQELKQLADEFNRWFMPAANGIDAADIVYVSRDEWRNLYAALARAHQPEAAAWVAPSECDSPQICSHSRTCAGQFGTKRTCSAQQPAQVVPEGFVLVPVVLTEAMKQAGAHNINCNYHHLTCEGMAAFAWKAMVDAAQGAKS